MTTPDEAHDALLERGAEYVFLLEHVDVADLEPDAEVVGEYAGDAGFGAVLVDGDRFVSVYSGLDSEGTPFVMIESYGEDGEPKEPSWFDFGGSMLITP